MTDTRTKTNPGPAQPLFDAFTNRYAVAKTLRFRLKPQGKTEAWIKEKKLLQKDEELAEKYKHAKKVIDEYHKDFIHRKLTDFSFKEEDLQKFDEIYKELKGKKADDKLKKALATQQEALRKAVAKHLANERLFGKELIKADLPAWLENNPVLLDKIDDPQAIIKDFEKWTTYFTGFNENRKNIYASEPHGTSIGYRLIHENLPRFLDNIQRYKKAKNLGVDFSGVEETFNVELDDFFSVTGFNKYLTQQGIDQYNQIRGGQSLKANEKQQGINEKINLYVQHVQSQLKNAPDEAKNELSKQIKEVRACQLEKLHKQILSDRSMLSFRLEDISKDADLCEQITSAFHVNGNHDLIGQSETDADTGTDTEDFNIIAKLETVLGEALENADPEKLYIKNDRSVTDISQYLFREWELIARCLEYYAERKLHPSNKTKRKTWLSQAYCSFADIHTALKTYFDDQYKEDELRKEENSKDADNVLSLREQKGIALNQPLFGYFKNITTRKNNEETNLFEKVNLLEDIRIAYDKAKPVLDNYKDVKEEKLKNEKEEVKKIKHYLDALMDLQHFLKPLHFQLKKKEEKQAEAYDKDGGFYSKFDELYAVINRITPLYNKARNYLTKKPYSVEKYKLNFENSTLADGWDRNKERANGCVLFIKDEQYFLGVMDKEHNTLFEDSNTYGDKNSTTYYQKMVYKQVANAGKDIQNLIRVNGLFQRKTKNLTELKRKYIPDIAKIKESESYKKGENFIKKDLEIFIDYYKKAASSYWDWCKFCFRPSNKYEDFREFTDHINSQAYQIKFEPIYKKYIDQYVTQGKLYLFQIYSKDFSPETKGRPNLQTLYWKALFDGRNLRNVVYKLDGQAELFHRRKSIEYPDNIWKKGHHANDPKKKQNYPIIKDRRYAKDTYLFHVPITCNFKASGVTKFNNTVNKFLKNNPDINIIGIDRGERHLAYYTVINQRGEIVQDKNGDYIQRSLNKPLESKLDIPEPIRNKDYQEDLNVREGKRQAARKSWDTIEKIKDLKTGYLSQVVHKIATLMVEHNAIVVFEDLNFGFKKGRFKIEKQVYQKLEKTLIDKLNYLVFKDREPDKPGGTYNALQLTAPFKSFKELGKQTGFIFYVPAYHTSKICPATGFVNLLYPRYETVSKAKCFFDKFDRICFNKDAGYFEFYFNYKKFTDKVEGSKQDWVVCSHGKRLENFKKDKKNNVWDSREIDLTEKIKKLFSDNSIEFADGSCLINRMIQQDTSDFFKSLIHLLKLTLQMRNSRIGTDEDWLISPVKGSNGVFFDSRDAASFMPKNADANGAYHIALKGLLMLNQLRDAENADTFKPDQTNKAWYKFVQEKSYQRA